MRSGSPFVATAGFYAWALWIALLLLGAAQMAHLEARTPDADFTYGWGLQRTAPGAPLTVVLDQPTVRRVLPGLAAPVSAKRRGLDGRAALMGWIALASLAVAVAAAVPTAAVEHVLDPSSARRVHAVRGAAVGGWLVPLALTTANGLGAALAHGLVALVVALAVAALGAVPSSRAFAVRAVTGLAAAGFVTALVLDAAARPPRGSADTNTRARHAARQSLRPRLQSAPTPCCGWVEHFPRFARVTASPGSPIGCRRIPRSSSARSTTPGP